MKRSVKAKPFLKWAGGKKQIIAHIEKIVKDISYNKYFEPFLGGGAVFFHLNPKKAFLNDINKELINAYEQVRDDFQKLVEILDKHKEGHLKFGKDYYYQVRSLDRSYDYKSMDSVEKAGRFIYLNKTCYNGLYRVNQNGEFNTPIGKYKTINLYDYNNLKLVSNILQDKENIKISMEDFRDAVVNYAGPDDLVYFDPPYDFENSNGFVYYSSNGFSRTDLEDLKILSDELIRRGCHVLISNNDTNFVRELFNEKQYKFSRDNILALRTINSDGRRRSKRVNEVLIYGHNNLSSSK